jgi:ABC-type bacteriocin/lantibiotic exporter with double-glycine peptidase domain
VTTTSAHAPATHAAVLSLQRLLWMRGIRSDASDLLARCPHEATPGWFVQRLAEHGLTARIVQVPPERLHRLRTPALLCLRDGSAAVLTRASSRAAVLERHDGARERLHTAELSERYAGTALEELVAVRHARSLFALWQKVLLADRRVVVEALLLSLLLSGLGLLSPWLAGLTVDGALPDGAHGMLGLIAAGTVLVAASQSWLGWLREVALQAIDLRLQSTALRETFARLLLRPYSEAAKLTVGHQMQRIDSAERATHAAADLTFGPVLDLMLVLSHCLALFVIAPLAGGLLFAFSLLAVGLGIPFALSGARVEGEKIDAGARSRGLLHELIGGAMAIKAAGAARACVARWIGALIDERALGLSRERIDLGAGTMVLGLQQLATASVICFGGYAALQGSLSLGALASAWLLAEGLNAALGRLLTAMGQWATVIPHVRRVNGLLALNPADDANEAAGPRAEASPEFAIALENVWFRYGPSEPWILKDYSLKVRSGELAKLSGASGQGKTTVLRLIAGLLTPERGTVRVLGMAPRAAQNRVAYLPQDAYLLEGSLLANLMLLSGASRERVVQAAQATGLSDWVRTLPMGLETVLPPGGGNLSGGQRQWVLLTAAVASQRPIILLDEALSHIDPATRAELARRALFVGKSVVAVSHEEA